MSQIQSR